MWTKPAYTDLRIGFEVTMYFASRYALLALRRLGPPGRCRFLHQASAQFG